MYTNSSEQVETYGDNKKNNEQGYGRVFVIALLIGLLGIGALSVGTLQRQNQNVPTTRYEVSDSPSGSRIDDTLDKADEQTTKSSVSGTDLVEGVGIADRRQTRSSVTSFDELQEEQTFENVVEEAPDSSQQNTVGNDIALEESKTEAASESTATTPQILSEKSFQVQPRYSFVSVTGDASVNRRTDALTLDFSEDFSIRGDQNVSVYMCSEQKPNSQKDCLFVSKLNAENSSGTKSWLISEQDYERYTYPSIWCNNPTSPVVYAA